MGGKAKGPFCSSGDAQAEEHKNITRRVSLSATCRGQAAVLLPELSARCELVTYTF